MGKKYQSYATIPRYLSFLLGKGGNPYVSKTLHKKLVQVRFLPCPQHAKRFRQSVDDARTKLPKNKYIFREFHTFPVTEGYEI